MAQFAMQGWDLSLDVSSQDVSWFELALGLGFRSWLGSGVGEKFANCTCRISKLCSTFCKLCRLTNCVQHHLCSMIDLN